MSIYPLTKSGVQLISNGLVTRLAGGNAYWLGLDDNNGGTPGTFPSHEKTTAAITGLKTMGANVIRAHSIGTSVGTSMSYETAAGVYNDANFDSADWAVYQAGLQGVYLMVPLTDNLNKYYGGKWNFVHWAFQQNPTGITDTPGTTPDDVNENQFFANTTAGLRIRALFKDYISHWMSHVNPYTGLTYATDPTIAIIETGNEIHYAAEIGTNEWTQDICAYVKSIAPGKLLADGSGRTGVQAANMPGLTAAACDILDVHYYPVDGSGVDCTFGTTTTKFSGNSALTQVATDATATIGGSKVFMVGEYPWTRSDVSSWYTALSGNSSISGDLFWVFIPDYDATTMNPGPPTGLTATPNGTGSVSVAFTPSVGSRVAGDASITGKSFAVAGNGYVFGNIYTAPSSTSLTSAWWYLANPGTSPQTFYPVLYATSAGVPSGALLASGVGVTLPAGMTPAWVEMPFTSPYTVTSGTQYLIGLLAGLDGAQGGTYSDSTAGKLVNYYTSNGSNTVPAMTWPSGGGSGVSQWASYVVGGVEAITGYTFKSYPGGVVQTATASPVIFNGLVNGAKYSFVGNATNSSGNSPDSAASNIVQAGSAATPGIVTQAVDSGDAGAGDTYVIYSPAQGTTSTTWQTAPNSGDYDSTDTYIDSTGSMSITWTGGTDGVIGSTCALYVDRDFHYGNAIISIDGTDVATVSLYNASRLNHSLIYTSPALAVGKHTISMRWAGTKDPASTGTVISFDEAIITNCVARIVGSPDGTTITAPTDPAIINQQGTLYTLTSGAQVAVNGVADPVTNHVDKLYYLAGTVYQHNTYGNWYATTDGSAYVAVSDPTGGTALSAPTNLSTSTISSTSVTFSYAVPINNGGLTLTGFTVSRDGFDSTGFGTYITTVPATQLSIPFSQLIAGDTYNFTVTANYSNGVSGPSASMSWTSIVTSGGSTGGTPAGTGPIGPSGTWKLAFEDDFPGSTLDLTKWSACEGSTMNNVTCHASNITVANSIVYLKLASSSSGSMISTQPAFGGPGGYQCPVGSYAEAYCFFPGDGTHYYNWAAWWTSATPWPAGGEHDIAEVLSGGVLTSHYISPAGNPQTHQFAFMTGFHTYGLHRKTSSADLYLDGTRIASYGTSDSGNVEGLMLNTGRGGYEGLGQSGALACDWVRVWEPA